MKNWFIYVIGIIAILVIIKQCEKEPEIKIETVTEYVKVTDTITNTIIQPSKTVYVNRYVDKVGEKVIVYVDKPNDSTIQANQYDTKLESNNAIANLKITTTGELLDVQGTIDYTQTNTTTTITKIKPKSGAFIYLETSFNKNPERFELGIDYQLRNKFLIGASIDYNTITQSNTVNFKFGIRIF